ncbi:GGDEF domain-containing protein [Crenobacter sp. SG2303]|uniref:diguanylate cyclase n=1 Tax=Crenobacter oryzisoli TaxID=3056844 RepID=A0ABT7XI22_9NEIS|nr:GGDEF domain-containing protein [Crenobacter sp. SG2303]MDN0073426.1 GGDEF domain-containing protein [Crenobacter sp. SG2303]
MSALSIPCWRNRSLCFSGLLCALALAMASLTFSALQIAENQVSRLARPTLKNNLWVTTQLQLEALRFHQSMDGYLLGRDPVDTVRLRLDLLASRFQILKEYGTDQHMSATTWQQMIAMQRRLDGWSRQLAALPKDPELARHQVRKIETELESHLEAIHQMTLEVHLDMTEVVDNDRIGTKANFATLARALAGLGISVLAMLAFLAILLFRTRRLSRHLAGLNSTLEQQVEQRTRALHDSEERLRLILTTSPIGVGLIRDSDGCPLFINRPLAERLGLTDYPDRIVLPTLLDCPTRYYELYRRYRRERELRDCEAVLRGIDGPFPSLLTVLPLAINGEAASLIWVYDNSNRQQLEDELRHLATTDSLTELHNRRAFFAEAEPLIQKALQQGIPYSLIVLDIDHFKHINDSFGHPAGDQALRHLADMLRDLLRESDICSRLGGEEFAVLLPNTTQSSAVRIAERLRRHAEALDVALPTGQVMMTISLGVAELRPGDRDLAGLFARADRALYDAKHQGRNRTSCLQ